MAKSSRASTKKRNKVALRTKVFGAAHDARTARLSAKLQELVDTPNVDGEKTVDSEATEDSKPEMVSQAENADTEDVQDDAMEYTGVAATHKAKSSKSSHRVTKIAGRRPRNQVVFPSEAARKKRQAKGRKA